MNPYKNLRQKLNMTQAELARRAHVTQQVVTNLEAGLYYKPPISISQLFPSLPPHLYTEWQKEQRISNSHHFDHADTHNGWHQFRLSVHPTSFRGFSKLLVYQPSMLAEYERYHRNADSLSLALRQVGLSPEAVGRLLHNGS